MIARYIPASNFNRFNLNGISESNCSCIEMQPARAGHFCRQYPTNKRMACRCCDFWFWSANETVQSSTCHPVLSDSLGIPRSSGPSASLATARLPHCDEDIHELAFGVFILHRCSTRFPANVWQMYLGLTLPLDSVSHSGDHELTCLT